MLSRVDANKVDVTIASKVVAVLLSGLSNAPDSSVVASFDDLPATVCKEVADQGEKTARGVFHSGSFYLVTDEHASATGTALILYVKNPGESGVGNVTTRPTSSTPTTTQRGDGAGFS